MTMAGCYDLVLECDGEDCAAGRDGMRAIAAWNLELGSACRAAARRAGWRWDNVTGLCRCPNCVKRGAGIAP
jgi:hypothetical protein